MSKNFIYEYETEKYTITPEDFYEKVREDFFKKTGHSLSDWIESAHEFKHPKTITHIKLDDFIITLFEAEKRACYTSYYLRRYYEFLMRWDEGRGVCYAKLKCRPPRKKLKKISKNFKKVLDKAARK